MADAVKTASSTAYFGAETEVAMVINEWGKQSVGLIVVKDEYCDGLDFRAGQAYEFWEIDDDWISVEDESAKDLESEGIHGGYIYAKTIVKEFRYYTKETEGEFENGRENI